MKIEDTLIEIARWHMSELSKWNDHIRKISSNETFVDIYNWHSDRLDTISGLIEKSIVEGDDKPLKCIDPHIEINSLETEMETEYVLNYLPYTENRYKESQWQENEED